LVKTTIKTTISPTIHTTVERPDKLLKSSEPSGTFLSSFYDSSTFTRQTPAIGSLVYCQLGPVEHSGIYIGNNQIVQLNGKGLIECVSPNTFTNHITTFDPDIFIQCHTRTREPIGNARIAGRAMDQLNKKRNYHLLMDNCHQFSAGCISGDFENPNNFLSWLKDRYQEAIDDQIIWLRWRWY
jgi:hypothetical protein